jgi:thiol-disulfide isomerase/thioredoxin
MKPIHIAWLVVASWLATPGGLPAQPTNTVPSVHERLLNLVRQGQAKVDAGKHTEADFAQELKDFDELIAAEQSVKTDEAAQVVYLKAMLYLEVFEDHKKGGELMKQIAHDFPDSKYGRSAGNIVNQIAAMDAELNSQEIQMTKQSAAFPIGQPPDDIDVKDLTGKPLSIAAHKGKVLLIDFWATWCPGCVMEVPGIIATFQKHHAEGFDVISVSLDDDRDELQKFLKLQTGMTWPQFFDGRGPHNQLAVQYGIQLIPFSILLDRNGRVVGTDLQGPQLEAAVSAALAKK